ncbi:MAG: hypothetical protein ACI8UO_005575 [Verrucomicrobiales bacterium]|jgi:hypothetical protein
MKTIDLPEKKFTNEVLAEIRRIKEEIAAEHGNDVRSLGRDLQRRQKDHARLVSPATNDVDVDAPQ